MTTADTTLSEQELSLGESHVTVKELAAVALVVFLADQTIYHTEGFAGPACCFLIAPLILALGMPGARTSRHLWIVATMLLLLGARLVWLGSAGLVLYGVALLVGFAMCLKGLRPFVLEGIAYGSLAGVSGLHGVIQYGRAGSNRSLSLPRSNWLNLILPVLMCGLFGTIFILANPDLATAFGENVSWFIKELEARLLDVLPSPLQLLFWLATAWLTIGIFRPILNTSLTEDTTEDVVLAKQAPAAAPQFEALRNTLVTLIVLFAIYLVFEFGTLWFRDFPEGFYYAGYAHKGAAWLTAALALATLVLSAVFRGRVLSDSRRNRLHWLAWIWSFENLLLALAVYNRLLIYVGFNGMTWMRVLGFFGVSTVVVGFVFVMWKIQHDRNFLWLVQRHLLTVFVAGYLFLLTPIDTLVVTYNTRRILSGDSAACMQIGVQETNTEALPLLLPLLDCPDDQIRRGVAALLADRQKKIETRVAKQRQSGWTAVQFAEPTVLRKLNQHSARWSRFSSDRTREAALKAFYDYAYQWY